MRTFVLVLVAAGRLYAVGHAVIPVMTSNTAPSGVASASEFIANGDPWHAFAPALNGWVTNGSALPQWLQYQLTAATTITTYSIVPWSVDNFPSRSPKNWVFAGSNNGSTWTTIDTKTGYTSWTINVASVFQVSPGVAYSYYRLTVSVNGGDAYTGIHNLQVYDGTGLAITAVSPVTSGTYCDILVSGDTCPLSASVVAGDVLVVITGHPGGDTCSTTQAYTSLRATTFTRRIAVENVSGAQSNGCISSAPITSSGTEIVTITGLGSNVPAAMYVYVAHVTSAVFGTGNSVISDFLTTINTGNVTGTASTNMMLWCVSVDSSSGNPYTSVSPTGADTGFGNQKDIGVALYRVNIATGTYSCTFNKAAGFNRAGAAAVLMTYNAVGGSVPRHSAVVIQ